MMFSAGSRLTAIPQASVVGRLLLAKGLARDPGRMRGSASGAHDGHLGGVQKLKTLHEQTVAVPTFGGSLWTKTPFSVAVLPLGPHEYPNLDRAMVKITTTEDSLKKTDISVELTQDAKNLSIRTDALSVKYDLMKTVRQDIKMPMVHNLKVEAVGKASVDAQGLIESDYCHLTSEEGDITATEIRTAALGIQSKSGEILCSGHVQGNIKISTMSGNVISDKRFTGPALEINTDSGDIRIASCYSDTSKFSTNKGSLNLRNLHNESYIAIYEKGDLKMLGLDGSANIFVKQGDVDCQISRIRAESRIHVEEGDINVKISDTHPIKITIEANDIIPDVKFKTLGTLSTKDNVKAYSCSLHPDKFSPSIHIIAENGNVNLESQDWAASLGLKMPITYGKDKDDLKL